MLSQSMYNMLVVRWIKELVRTKSAENMLCANSLAILQREPRPSQSVARHVRRYYCTKRQHRAIKTIPRKATAQSKTHVAKSDRAKIRTKPTQSNRANTLLTYTMRSPETILKGFSTAKKHSTSFQNRMSINKTR